MLTLALALIIGAGPVSFGAPEREDRWTDYTRTTGFGPLYGLTATTSSPVYLDDKDENLILIPWGVQVEITCTASTSATAYRDNTVVCMVQDPALEVNEIVLGGNSLFGDYSCGEGCAYYDDSAGPSGKAGHLPCTVVPSGSTKFRIIRRGAMQRAPTWRTGICTGADPGGAGEIPIGGPCDSGADCGTGQTCSEGVGSRGVYLIAMATGGETACAVEISY